MKPKDTNSATTNSMICATCKTELAKNGYCPNCTAIGDQFFETSAGTRGFERLGRYHVLGKRLGAERAAIVLLIFFAGLWVIVLWAATRFSKASPLDSASNLRPNRSTVSSAPDEHLTHKGSDLNGNNILDSVTLLRYSGSGERHDRAKDTATGD